MAISPRRFRRRAGRQRLIQRSGRDSGLEVIEYSASLLMPKYTVPWCEEGQWNSFDGQTLTWVGRKLSWKATSGLTGFQLPQHQCLGSKGPTPEGEYRILLLPGTTAVDDGSGRCSLAPSWRIETIPRGATAGSCEPYWANWGTRRVRFEPATEATRKACSPSRGGFYLHDSTKGYSHGCIEIQGTFFDELLKYAAGHPKVRVLRLTIRYVPGRPTNGGTYVAP